MAMSHGLLAGSFDEKRCGIMPSIRAFRVPWRLACGLHWEIACAVDWSHRGHIMRNQQDDTTPLHEPLAELERELISAYVAGAGYDLAELLTRTDTTAKRVLADASQYASAKLGEIESRSYYLHHLHGEP